METPIYTPAYVTELQDRITHLEASLVTVRSERDYFQTETTEYRGALRRSTRTLAEIAGAAEHRLEADGTV